MSDKFSQDRSKHFEEYRLLWLAIHHFLPAKLLQEFVSSLIASTSGGALSLDMLFETILAGEEGTLASWVIAPRVAEGSLANALQHVVRIIGWQTDALPLWMSDDLSEPDRARLEGIESAMAFARVDLAIDDANLDQLAARGDNAIKVLRTSIATLKKEPRGEADWNGLFEQVPERLAMPVSAALFKHLGDLCADSDRWLDARRLYQHTESLLAAFDQPIWNEFSVPLKVIATQSVALATQMIDGAQAAASRLHSLVEGTPLVSDPLLRLNMGVDALFTEMRSSDTLRIPQDYRATLLSAPLLISARNRSDAFEYWAHGGYVDAIQRFWAVLRRQIALGSGVESRTTKAHYAECLIEFLHADLPKRVSSRLFLLSTRLLMESGDVKVSERMEWTSELVAKYVNSELIDGLIARIDGAPGFKTERSLVLICTFERWLVALSPEDSGSASRMLCFLAEVARDNAWSFFSNRNIPGAAFESLQKVARRRPEWRSLASSFVIEAAKAKFSSHNVVATTSVLDAVSVYLDAFDAQERLNAVKAVLDHLDSLPASAPWAITSRATNILASKVCRELSENDPSLRERIVGTILKFGLAEEGQKSTLLFYLRDFPASAIESQVGAEDLKRVVDDMRRQASSNSSEATNNILALLNAPEAVGVDGVGDALEALIKLVGSPEKNQHAISFPFAYEPILALTQREDAIKQVIGQEVLKTKLDRLFDTVCRVWKVAANQPAIFAPFSIPKLNTPDSTIVHNWTFASIALAKMLERNDELSDAMTLAAQAPALKNSMALARVSRLTAGDSEPFDPAAISLENRETFYGALGQRLLLLRDLSQDRQEAVLRILLNHCFRLGPNGLDGALFSKALDLSIAVARATSPCADYIKRLENDRGLRLSLTPLLTAIVSSATP